MRKLLLFLCCSVLTVTLFAQEFEVPKNYSFTKTEDYTKYEGDIVKCIDWMLNTPVNTQNDKRTEANTFVMKWLTGSPTVSVEVKTEIVTFMDQNPELLMIFLGGWTKYALESKDYKNKIKGNLKGIESVIDFYSKNKANLKKDKNIEKYIKMKEKGTLEEFVTKNA